MTHTLEALDSNPDNIPAASVNEEDEDSSTRKKDAWRHINIWSCWWWKKSEKQVEMKKPELQQVPKTELSNRFKYEVDREIDQLPNIEDWENRPLYFTTGKGTSSSTKRQDDGSLPLHAPVEFDGELFIGKIFIRVRNFNTRENNAYFETKRRTKQVVIQGQFKERISCDNVWFGDIYEKPLNIISSVANLAIPIIRRLIPGVNVDFCDNPRIIVLLGGESRTISIDRPGDEPKMTEELKEHNTNVFGEFRSLNHRRKMLRNPKTASKYCFDPGYVYTFQLYDDIIDFCDYTFKMPLGRKINLVKMLNYQPFTFAARTSDDKPIFSFKLFHEDLIPQLEPSEKRSSILNTDDNDLSEAQQ